MILKAGVTIPLEAQEKVGDQPTFKMETLFVSKGDHKKIRLPKIVVKASFDREDTWPVSRHIPHNLGAAYCSITTDKDGMIYVLFETSHRPGRVDNVTFAKFNFAWLKEGNPPNWTDGLSGVKKK